MKRLSYLEMGEILLAYFLYVLGLKIILNFLFDSFSGININIPFNVGNFQLYFIYTIIILFIYLLILKFINKRKCSEIGFKSFSKKDLKFALIFVTVLFPVALIARIFDPSFDIWYANREGLLTMLAVVMLWVQMPFIVLKEELIERSLIQSRLTKAYGPLITILAVSINFGIAHFFLSIGGMLHTSMILITVFLGSIIMTTAYEKTKSIFTTMIIHFAYNVIVILQVYLHATEQIIYELIFWLVWAVLFFMFFKRSAAVFKELFVMPRLSEIALKEKIFIVIFAVIFPMFFFLLLNGII